MGPGLGCWLIGTKEWFLIYAPISNIVQARMAGLRENNMHNACMLRMFGDAFIESLPSPGLSQESNTEQQSAQRTRDKRIWRQ